MQIKHKTILAIGRLINLPIRCLGKLPWCKKKILVVKEDFLGDTVTWLPYARLLRDNYPASEYEITHVTRKMMIPLLSKLAIADKVETRSDYSSPIQWLCSRICFWLTHTCDIMIILFPGVYNKEKKMILTIDDTFQIFSYAKTILLSHLSLDMEFPLTSFYAHKILFGTEKKKSIHAAYNEVLESINIHQKTKRIDWTLSLNDIQYPWNKTDYFIVCPGASRSYRCWEEDKFSKLIDQLVAIYHYKVVLTGISTERDKCSRIYNQCLCKENIINTAGELSLIQLFSAVAKAKFVVSNETGTAHIGGVLGVMTFAICGGGDYDAFVPYPNEFEGKIFFSIFREDHSCFHCKWKIPCSEDKKSTVPCIKDITVEQVYKTILQHTERKNNE